MINIVQVIITELVDSEGLLLPSQALQESWRANGFLGQLSVQCAQTGCHKCACSMERSRTQVNSGLSCHADL